MRRALTFLLAALCAVAAALSLGSSPALAHNTFVDSDPADGQTLAVAPTAWTVRFEKSVPLESASGSVVNGDGTRTALNPPRHGDTDSVIVFDLPAGLTGDITARWRLVSTDGHVITGRVGFTVAAGAPPDTGGTTQSPGTGAPVTTTATDDNGTGVPEPVRVSLRLLNYLAIVLLGGILFVDLDIAGGAIATPRGRRFALWGAGAATAVPFLQFLVFTGDVRGEGEGLGSAIGSALSLTPGGMLLLRAATGAVIVLLVRSAITDGLRNRQLMVPIGASAAMYLVALAYVGHSRSQSLPLVGVPVDVLHTAAVAVWLGGLVAVLLVVVPAVPAAAAVAAFHRFGPAAARAVLVLAVTGVVQTARLHGGVTTLFTSGHGLLLLVKIALVAAMVRLAARNRRALAGHASAEMSDDRRVRALLVRTSLTETAYGIGVIALTAVLVAVTPG